MAEADIAWVELALGCLLMLIPLFTLWYFKTGLVKPMSIAFGRMALQLFFVGLYLKYIFEYNSIAINLLWVVIMMVAAGYTVVNRSELNKKLFIMPVVIGTVLNVLVNASVISLVMIGVDDFFNARYIIPICGMLIGNSLNSNIIGLRSLFKSLKKDELKLRYNIICGADKKEAMAPFVRDAIKEAFNPVIANTGTIGLIWLPGMMTGQILAGSDPASAIKYQIMIIVTIFVGSVISLMTAIRMTNKLIFDEYSNLKIK